MRRTFRCLAPFLVTLLALAACERPPTAVLSDDRIRVSPNAADAHAPGAPAEVPFSVTFPDDDPCTPQFDANEHLVTISGTLFVHSLANGNLVIRAERTITTDSGYQGRGEHTQVVNGNVFKLHLNDINTHPDGRKMHARLILVADLTTSPPSIRVFKGELRCIKT